MISEKVYEAMVKGSDRHGMFGSGNTYGGHPVAAAVAIETLNIYKERNITDHVKSLSVLFQQRLDALAEHPLVGQARGVGLIGALEIVKDKETKEQYPLSDKVAAQIANYARAHNLILRPTPGDSVALCPPLIINDKELNIMFDRVELALNDMSAALA